MSPRVRWFVIVAAAAALVWAARAFDWVRQVRWSVAPPAVESDDWVMRHSCVSQLRRARWTWAEYAALLAELGEARYQVVSMREYARLATTPPVDRVLVGLRHDLDGNLCRATTMAQLEHAAGLRATYFVRHTDPYFGWGWPDVRRRAASAYRYRDIAALGHEIGVHLDALSMALTYGVDPVALLQADLAWMRAQGLDVVGAAAHGSPISHAAGFENYEIFAGMTTREALAWEGRRWPLGTLSLAAAGLAYETYHIPGDVYLSEAGGSWDGVDPVAVLRATPPGKRVQLLVHPVWWGKGERWRDMQ